LEIFSIKFFIVLELYTLVHNLMLILLYYYFVCWQVEDGELFILMTRNLLKLVYHLCKNVFISVPVRY